MWTVDGQKLKELREAKGLSQAELVRKAHVSVKTLGRYENGALGRAKHLQRIAGVLGVEPQAFILPEKTFPTPSFADMGWLIDWCEAVPSPRERFATLRPAPAKGELSFLQEVTLCLGRIHVPGATVRAVCSPKSDLPEVDAYFRANFDVADAVRAIEPSDRDVVERIFVEPSEGFRDADKRHIRKHAQQAGVRPFLISDELASRAIPNSAAAFKDGFGIVILRSHRESIAFLHFGHGPLLRFCPISDPRTIADLQHVFDSLRALATPHANEVGSLSKSSVS